MSGLVRIPKVSFSHGSAVVVSGNVTAEILVIGVDCFHRGQKKFQEAFEITIIEPVIFEKTNNLGFRPGPTQTGLYSHRSRLEALNFRFKKKKDCTIHVAKTKVLICAFVFAYADCWFSHAKAHMNPIFSNLLPNYRNTISWVVKFF